MSALRRVATRYPHLLAFLRLVRALLAPLRARPLRAARAYPGFWRTFGTYRSAGGKARLLDVRPMLEDATSDHTLDPHYFYQGAWAAQRIAADSPPLHHDVGSQSLFVAMLTAVTDVRFLDIRPLGVALPRLEEQRGSVLELPMDDRSVSSLSCLHVAEHVGLGRYGDPLDGDGTRRAAAELSRVLAPGGRLYFSLPVGRRRTEFNAHRVHGVADVLAMFPELELKELAVVTDDARFVAPAPVEGWDAQEYACGMFLFERAA